MFDQPPTVAIIIVTYNSAAEIAECLKSLVGHTAPFETTITVVDNASTDGTPELVRERFPAVQVIGAGSNQGYSRANNLGIRATRSDYVLLLNPDTVCPPGAVQTLVRCLAQDPDAAIAGARMLNDRGFPELSWGPSINPWNELRQKVVSDLYHRKIRRVVRYVDKLSRQGRPVPWVSGASMVIRRSDLEAVGLLDERYDMYMEDVDLCRAMTDRKRRVLYCAAAEVLHYRGRSAVRNPETEKMRRRSQMAYYDKHLPLWSGMLRAYLSLTGKHP